MRVREGAVALVLAVVASSASAQGLAVANAWVLEPPPGTSAAVFMTIENTGVVGRRIVAAESPACERVEIHRTLVEGGIARMQRLDTLDLPPGDSIELAPRGLHLMLVRPTALRVGDTISITLRLQRGDPLRVEAVVAKRKPSPEKRPAHGD